MLIASFGEEISLSRLRGIQIMGSGNREGASFAIAARSVAASKGLAARNCRNLRRLAYWSASDGMAFSPRACAATCGVLGAILPGRDGQINRVFNRGGDDVENTMAPRDPRKINVEKLSEKQAKAEHVRLEAEIRKHDDAYYQKDEPTVSDAQYDALRRRYEAIEEKFPDLRTLESLSRKVGAAPARGFAKVRHAVPMLSLGNAFSAEDVADFVDRIRRFLNLKESDTLVFDAEPKIDGLSMSLRYEDGLLVRGATRGDGSEGEDVTANVRTIDEIPKKLKGRRIPAVCEVRGEIYMTKADFMALNKRQAEEVGRIFANPRTPPAGAARPTQR